MSVNDEISSYIPRQHSKIAEKEGFNLGSGSDEHKTLFVSNLDPALTDEFLATVFNQIGAVTKCKIIFEGTNDPFAFIEFSDHGQAAQALQALNKRSLLDKEINVSWALEPGQQDRSKSDTTRHFHVFVGDLSADIDNIKLREAFNPFGEISEAKVIRDTSTNKSKGYGFVSYPKREDAERAIEQMNGQWLGRRTIRTNWASRKPEERQERHYEKSYDEVFNQSSPDNTSVYVGNISTLSEDDIREAFIIFGSIVEVRIFKVQGYAFVKFDQKEAAAKAILQMNNQEISGQTVRCSWGKSGENNTSATNTSSSSKNGNSQYWQYYSQYYNNPQMMQQWSSYWQQNNGGGSN